MGEAARTFRYVAKAATGRTVKGAVAAPSEDAAFRQLKREGLSPLRISPASASRSKARALSDRECADFLSDLGALLKAGSDLRSALAILGGQDDARAIANLVKELAVDIGGGGAVDKAFSRALPGKHAFVSALIATGEASGDLAGGLERAADMLSSRIKLRDQLVSALSYPAFVLVSTVAAFLVILLFLVPSLAPLADTSPSGPPLLLGALLSISTLLRENILWIAAALCIGSVALVGAIRGGALTDAFERFVLDGPPRRTSASLVYGAFAVALGDMLAGGAPMREGLRLSITAVRSKLARARLEPALAAVKEGEMLSAALQRTPGFPAVIARLAAVGEASGALGPMLARAGRIEEQGALRRLEAAARLLGPMMIILLGGMIGLLMAGLLGGIQDVGNAALQ